MVTWRGLYASIDRRRTNWCSLAAVASLLAVRWSDVLCDLQAACVGALWPRVLLLQGHELRVT